MNRIFRIVWKASVNRFVVASEMVKACGKGKQAGCRQRNGVDALIVTLFTLVLCSPPGWADDKYWDANNTALDSGGTGTWNTTDPFWSTNNDGVSGPYSAWDNGALDDAFFGGTVGTITLAEPITVHNLTFQDAHGWILEGDTLTLGGVDPTITSDGRTTIHSVIAGTAGLTKDGGGWLQLTGANTFSGDINVNQDRLIVANNSALGDAGNMIYMAASTRLDGRGAAGDMAGRTVTLLGGEVSIAGAGVGSAYFTGAGGLLANAGVFLTNDANDYTGRTRFFGVGTVQITSIADLGVASALGAPTTVVDGTIHVINPNFNSLNLDYIGDGDSSNRNWLIQPGSGPGGIRSAIRNMGTGTLTLTGDIAVSSGSSNGPHFVAGTADLELLGAISSNNGRDIWFIAESGQTLSLGDASTFGGRAVIRNGGQVEAGTLADSGVASSLGAGSIINISNGGTLSYTGAGVSTNRDWQMGGSTLNNDGSGALILNGPVSVAAGTATLGGSFTGANNVVTGVIGGAGNLRSGGDATWILSGANTYSGDTIVDGGELRAGSADAFGDSSVFEVNGGTLDLNNFDQAITTLSGSGGTVDLGSATLTLEGELGTSASYAGSIAGTGGLTKLGASEQTLSGANTYTGDTTIGGGTLNLDFGGANAPASDIIASASTLNMDGGTLNVIGAAGNTQTFGGLNITAGNNTINAEGDMTVNLGAINRTGGLMDFDLPTNGNITTTNTLLGGWATVHGTDYAKVEGGNIVAFVEADYTDKDNAANWLDNEFITDVDGFFGTLNGSVQLGGLRYTQPVSTTVNVDPGETLGVDGTIIVAPTVLNTDQVITGGMLTGAIGGTLGLQQNSTGNFTIDSQIVDNGGSIGFVKAGTGLATLSNANNSYTGSTAVAEGTLSVSDIGDGGVNSGIGASSADSSNLVLEGSTLQYTGAGDTSDRGFTFAKSGGILGSGIEVTDAGANLTFDGLVTSPDDSSLTKSGDGTLTLGNGANDYVGPTIVTGGLLSVNTLANGGLVSGIGQSGSDSANLVLDGGGLQYTGTTVEIDRGLTLGDAGTIGGNDGGTIDVTDAATTLTISGTIVHDNDITELIKEGDGTLVLSGTNTWVGGSTVNGGTLRAGSTQAFGQPNTQNSMVLANTAGVTLDLDGFNNFVGPLYGGGANGGNVTLGDAELRIGGNGGIYTGVISGTGSVRRTDGGTQTFVGCNNTYTGRTFLQGGSLSVDCLANGGDASGIGASSADPTNLALNNAILFYTGGDVTTDRGFQLHGGTGAISVENGTTLEFTGEIIGGGTFRKDGAGTIVLSGTNSGTGNTHINEGVLRAGTTDAFTSRGMVLDNQAGVLLDLDSFDTTVDFINGGGANGGNIALGSATLTLDYAGGGTATYGGAISGSGGLVKEGSGLTQRLTGCDSSYTGSTVINAGTLQVTCLSDGGVNSSIGASTSDPANLVLNGGTLNYVGTGGSTNRAFTLGANGGTIASNGSGIIEFTHTGPVTLDGSGTARTLTLDGTNTGTNIFAAQLDDDGAGVTSLIKDGSGLWRLTNANSSYTGVTTITGGGILEVDEFADGGQVSSIGAATADAANLVIGDGSTLRYTGAGDSTDRQFTLDTGVTFIESSGTGALQFTDTGTVALTGANTARTIALGGTNTGDNTMGGAIADNGLGPTTLAKNDAGTWILTGNNSYSGNTVINDGNLIIGNGGTTGNAGVGNVIVDSPTSTLSLNRSDTFTFDGTLSGPGTLSQIGSGTSILTSPDNTIGATTIENGTLQVDGGLETPTVDMTGTSALTVNGTLQADGPTQIALTGDTGEQTITVDAGGSLLANGDLGDGNDVVDLTGSLDTGTGTLGLGAGDDTLILNDGSQILGDGVDTNGGLGIDELVVNTALGYTLDGSNVDTFDILTKENTGELTLTGDHDFSVGANLDGGTLEVGGTLETPTLSMADDTILNVDGLVQETTGDPTTITGSAGTNTINVNIAAGLVADGNLGGGTDTVTLAGGTLNTGAGTLGLGDGDDMLVLEDGAFIEGAGVDAGNADTFDALILDNADPLTFDGGQTAGFELLLKQNAGSATMTGSQSFTAGTAINGGELDVDGNLETPAISLADDTTLNVDGTVEGTAGTQANITGSTGDNTVSVGTGGTLLANGNLGPGNDTLDVAGTLDTGGLFFELGDGDDTLTIHDDTNIIGTVAAGAGNDTFNTNIDTVADLGAVQDFETLSKTGSGELNINGPLSSDFSTINVLDGIVDVTAGGSVVAPPGEILDTSVATGATLNVDGSYTGSAGNDTFNLSGTVAGNGDINLADGDDTLTLNDGAVLDNAISGGTGTGDVLVLNNTLALTFDAGNTADFELLQKDNTGIATLTGSQSFTSGTTINAGTLYVTGSLETPTVDLAGGATLNVDGMLEAGGGTVATVTGDVGINTVSVGMGGTLLADGNLGAGEDLLDVTGTLDTNGGTFFLGDGDDNFIIHDGSNVIGTVDGGTGFDTRTYDINTTAALGALVNFEGVTKTGTGVLNVTGPGPTDLQAVEVLGGTLDVAAGASIVAIAGESLDTTVASGATLNVDGDFGCGDGDDTLTVAGTVAGSGTVDLCAGDDTLILHDNAVLEIVIDGNVPEEGSDTVVIDNMVTSEYDLNMIVNFEHLVKENSGEAILTGTGNFPTDTIINSGTLTVAGTLGTPILTMADDTVLNIEDTLQAVGGSNTVINGSDGINTVTVAAGGNLFTDADFGGGGDVFSSMGTVTGTLAFGAGDDTADFFRGDITGITSLDGGADSSDHLRFHTLALDGDTLPISNWERLSLLDDSRMTLGSQLNLNGGLMTIDSTSSLLVNSGAGIDADVDNAGLIQTQANRLTITGDYTGSGGLLQVEVSPANGTSGGLDVAGSVSDVTSVIFTSDGSELGDTTEPTQILVVSSANSTPGAFTAADGDTVRLDGSTFPWSFAQGDDNNWYLGTDSLGLLPEIPAYGSLPALGLLFAEQSDNLVHQRLAGERGADRDQCNLWEPDQRIERGDNATIVDDCRGFWMATSLAELEQGADPGFAVDGHHTGLYFGVDGVHDGANSSWHFGAYGGYLHGIYHTSGAGTDDLFATKGADIQLGSALAGLYASAKWESGTYLEGVLTGMLTKAKVQTEDGFSDHLNDSTTLNLSVRLGHRYDLGNDWLLESHLQLSGTRVQWDDMVDASGKQLDFEPELLGGARLGLRLEKALTSASGAVSRPWVTLSVADTWGENDASLRLPGVGPGGDALALPNYDLGTVATLDLGMEGQVSEKVSLFGVISASRELNGTSHKVQGTASAGFRIRW